MLCSANILTRNDESLSLKKSYILLSANPSVDKNILIKRHLNAKLLIHKGKRVREGDFKFHGDSSYDKFQLICLKVKSAYYIFFLFTNYSIDAM